MGAIEAIKRYEKSIVLVLIIILVIQSLFASFYISPTADELKHLVRGYVYLKTGDQRFNIGHPVLINSLNAVPLLFVKDITLPLEHETWKNNKLIDFTFQFFFHSGNDLERIFSLARIPTFLLSIILGIFIYLWAKKLYGSVAGVFALFLYSLCPNIIANSELVTNDLGGTLFIFLSMYTIWLFYKNPSFKSLLLSGFVFGLALMSKYYALHFIPAIIILLLIAYYKNKKSVTIYKFRKSAKINKLLNALLMLVIFFFISWFTLNLGYKFEGTFHSLEYNILKDPGVDKSIYKGLIEKSASLMPFDNKKTSVKIVEYVASNVPIMVPYHYVKGVFYISSMINENFSKDFYFLGQIYEKPPNYYYLFMFLLKVQIPLLIFIILTIVFYRRIEKNYVDDYFLLIPIVIFSILLFIKPVANGFRHFLPVLPLLFVFVSKLTNIKIKNQKYLNYIVIILILWYIVTPIRIFPYYIPFYNEFVGMDNGYKISVRGDIDWGQDLKLLKKMLDEKGITHISFSYFGQVYPEYYNINYTYLPSIGTYRYKGINTPLNNLENCTPVKGLVAISISNLKQPFMFKNESCFDWLKGLEPNYRVGYTIYIFNISNIR